MNEQRRSHGLTARIVALVLLLAASAAVGATPPQTAPANLRDMDGQDVVGEKGLVWKYAEVVVEWGFKKGTENLPFDGSIQSTYLLGMLGTARPLPGDKQTTMTGPLGMEIARGRRVAARHHRAGPLHNGGSRPGPNDRDRPHRFRQLLLPAG